MLGVLIPSLTTTSPLPAISDKASTLGFLVALNELLGGDSNERIQSKHNNDKNRQPDAARRIFFGVRQNGDSTREGIVPDIIVLSFVHLMCLCFCIFVLFYFCFIHAFCRIISCIT